MKKSWNLMWSDHFRVKYAETAERWKDCREDDRLVFCNTYGMVMRALASLPDNPDILVKSAMNSKFEEEQKCLDRIAAVFVGPCWLN